MKIEVNNFLTSIQYNTLLLFRTFSFKPYVTSVFLACKIAKNKQIPKTYENIRKIYNDIEKKPISDHNLKSALHKLSSASYVYRLNSGIYEIRNEKKINIKIKEQIKGKINYYGSDFLITEDSLTSFKESKNKNIFHYLSSIILTETFYNVPVTYNEIQEKLGFTRHDTKFMDLDDEEIKIVNNSKQYSAFEYTKFNITTIGKVYTLKEQPKVISRIHKYVKIASGNPFGDHTETCINNGSHVNKYKMSLLSRTCVPFFSNSKKDFITKLSENYQYSRMRKKTFCFQY